MEHKVDQIEGEGFISNIYHYFWLKDPILDVVPIINIPDTVLFKSNQIYAWYFEMNNITKRKQIENISLENIYKSFTKKCQNQEIIAMWVTKRILQNGKDDYVIEYLNGSQFKIFCNNVHPMMRDGVLQRFIQPKGLYNYIIKAHWSPKVCFLEKIQNYQQFTDKKIDIYERVVTFESEKIATKNDPIQGQVLAQILENKIHNLVDHIQNVGEIQIKRFILNFKMDNKNKLWFIFSSFLQLEQKDQKISKQSLKATYSLPHFIDVNSNMQQNIRKALFCYGECGLPVTQDKLFKIQFGIIIQSWEYKQRKNKQKETLDQTQIQQQDNENNNKNKIIPIPILKMMPKIKLREYQILKNDPQFRDQDSQVCENCLLKIMKVIQNVDKTIKGQKQQLRLVKKCDSQQIKVRYEKTMDDIQMLKTQINKNSNFANTLTNRLTMKTVRSQNLLKSSLFGEKIKPLRDLSTLATMEFNSNSKVSKLQQIDKILQKHPKNQFLEQISNQKYINYDIDISK